MFFYIRDSKIILEKESKINFQCDQIIEKEIKPWESYIFEDWLIKSYEGSRLYLEIYKIAWKEQRINELIDENKAISKKYDDVLVSYNDVLDKSWLSKKPSGKTNKIKDYSLEGEPSNDFERIMLEQRALLLKHS